MMEAFEWLRFLHSLPDATDEEIERRRAVRRREMEEEMAEFDEKWEGRTVKKAHEGHERGE